MLKRKNGLSDDTLSKVAKKFNNAIKDVLDDVVMQVEENPEIESYNGNGILVKLSAKPNVIVNTNGVPIRFQEEDASIISKLKKPKRGRAEPMQQEENIPIERKNLTWIKIPGT